MDGTSRWASLDVVRGLTVAAMLLVNNPGTWDAVYPPLRHAVWHGWTPTDLIFPLFLFIVGITAELSLGRRAAAGATDSAIRRRVVVRAGLIVLLGLALAAFPFVPFSRITEVRIPGVLQRIGICYGLGALLAWRRSDRAVLTCALLILLGYWATLTLVPAPGLERATIDTPAETIAAYLDRALLDGHLWKTTKTWDPEGPLSTLPAVATVLLGVLAGRISRREAPLPARLNQLFAWGVVGIVLGLAWNSVFPINKNLWTSSYVVFTAGVAAVLLATVTWAMDIKHWVGWTRPFRAFGLNPMVAFLGSGVMARALGSLLSVEWGGSRMSLQQAAYQAGFAPWGSPEASSLAYAVAFVALWYGILRLLEWRGWFFKV